MTPRRLRTSLLWLVFSLALSGCGASNNPPPSGSISIAPASITWNFPATTSIAAASVEFQPVVITVKDSNGIPLKGVNVIVSLDLSPGTSTTPAMGLYLSDSTTGQMIAPINTPTNLTTNDAGVIDLFIGMSLGGTASYAGVLYAYSGSLMTTAQMTATCQSVTGGTQCN